jgi:hypothetical protein
MDEYNFSIVRDQIDGRFMLLHSSSHGHVELIAHRLINGAVVVR